MVRGVCSSYATLETVRALEDDPVGYPAELWKQMAELDLIGLMLPGRVRRLGDERARRRGRLHGARARARAVAALRERGDGARACCCAAGTDEQKQAWLPRIASGDAIVTTAWLEPGNGFGPRGVQATRDRRRRRLRARRREVARAVRAGGDRAARARPHRRRRRRRRPVPRRPDGGGRRRCSSSSRSRPTRSTRSTLVGRARPASTRIGARAARAGRRGTTTMLDGIILLAAQAVGGARYALDITVQYAKDREQFDKPLGAFQAIAHYLADAVDRGRRRARRSCTKRRGRARTASSIDRLAPMAKLFACKTFRDVTAMAQQVFGGVGFTRRVRHPALLPPGQAAADLVVGRPRARGAGRGQRARRVGRT